MTTVPAGEWFCEECRGRNIARKRSSLSGFTATVSESHGDERESEDERNPPDAIADKHGEVDIVRPCFSRHRRLGLVDVCVRQEVGEGASAQDRRPFYCKPRHV